MNQQYQKLLDESLFLFEKEDYDAAVSSLIQVYEMDYCKEEIKEFLYQNFIYPNEKEYERIYKNTLDRVNYYPYNELAVDFIAVSDSKYYLFDKLEESFLGALDFEQLLAKRDADCNGKNDVRAVLVSNIWDIRLIIETIYRSIWNATYLICDDKSNYLFSFLKVPQIGALFYNHVKFFENITVLEQYFKENASVYLPKILLGNDTVKYHEIMDKLHKERIDSEDRDTEGIIVSFCIPSYNRGDIAYENVTQYLKSQYDAEIEVVISNNGTMENTEGYDKIEKLQDSRIAYNKMEENTGFIGNLLKVIQMAKGKFVVLSSDEDFFEVEQMTDFLNFIIAHQDLAVIRTTGLGGNFASQDDKVINELNERLVEASNVNYITGICFNHTLLTQNNILDMHDKYSDNFFYQIYPHVCIAFMLCQYGAFGLSSKILWESRDKEETYSHITLYNGYCNLESRILQQKEIMRFITNELISDNKTAFPYLFVDRISKTYSLLHLANLEMGDLFKEKFSWIEICLELFDTSINMLEIYKNYFSEGVFLILSNFCDKVCLDHLEENPQINFETEEEREKNKNLCAQAKEYFSMNRTLKGFAIENYI